VCTREDRDRWILSRSCFQGGDGLRRGGIRVMPTSSSSDHPRLAPHPRGGRCDGPDTTALTSGSWGRIRAFIHRMSARRHRGTMASVAREFPYSHAGGRRQRHWHDPPREEITSGCHETGRLPRAGWIRCSLKKSRINPMKDSPTYNLMNRFCGASHP